MKTIVDIATVISAFGTLIVALLVYQFGRQQAAFTNTMANRQYALDRQNFRLKLLEQRIEVLADVREVWGDYLMHARPQPELTSKLMRALQKAKLIYNDDVVTDLDQTTTLLIQLHSNAARQKEAQDYYDDEQMRKDLLEKQFALEDKLLPILEPIIKKIEGATRVEEPLSI